MSASLPPILDDPDQLLRTRGSVRTVDAFVTGCAFSADGSLAGFATGEGELHLAPASPAGPDAWRHAVVHDGSILGLAADIGGDGFLTGGDDNRLCRTSGAGETVQLAGGRRWVEHVASIATGKPGAGLPAGLIASVTGRQIELRDAAGTLLKTLDHDSTVSGIAFDSRGKRIAASHYNGATLWFTASKSDSPRRLAWKGSHVGVALHPDGDALVTAMQENELHGWRLADSHNMRMSGYPQKTQSFGFSRTGRWLATSGAEMVVLWPFFGGGPMGKAPTELGGVPDAICTRVAFHPQHELLASGYSDGTVLMCDVATKRVLPICGAGAGGVTALAFNRDGSRLAFGSEQGRMALVDLAAH